MAVDTVVEPADDAMLPEGDCAHGKLFEVSMTRLPFVGCEIRD